MDITCVLIDDERMAIDHLLTYIEKLPFLRVLGQFTDPVEALSFLETTPVDVVFLDVEMPNHPLDGMDLANILGDRQRYIFTTAYPKYALKSYDYDAVDFLHKPFPFERFTKAVQKARLSLTGLRADSPSAIEMYRYIRNGGKLRRIDLASICYIESERSYLNIYTEQDRITMQMPLSEIEEQLPRSLFARVHKSFIVARNKLELIEANQVGVLRAGKINHIPIGDAYRKAMMEKVEPTILRKK